MQHKTNLKIICKIIRTDAAQYLLKAILKEFDKYIILKYCMRKNKFKWGFLPISLVNYFSVM